MIEHERSPLRLPLILIAIISLLAAMWAGLIRIGWDYASWQPDLAQAHGALMVSGFLGTVIGLERAVAAAAVYKNRLLYIVPLLAHWLEQPTWHHLNDARQYGIDVPVWPHRPPPQSVAHGRYASRRS